ncbi:hypothetical protein M3Y97_00484500 [Aphelenchoides bicaudatus]|nr:hypothetical protein M3Y97_00484500 [Aphelenchoides bicaudatus]
MFHLAPVGLEPQRRSTRDRHIPIQNQILSIIQELKQGPKDTVYTNKVKLTRELVKSLDIFFCHGLLVSDKCYWRFVREFLPMSIQQSLKFEWSVNTDRGLSIAWLKNALNQQTLHFQMLAFVSQPKITARYYDKNACIRNQPVLKRIAVGASDLGEIQFRIENLLQRRQYDAPVAQLTSQAPIVHVPSSSAIETKPYIKTRALNTTTANDIILSASFQHANDEFMQRFPGNRSLVQLTDDLPRVEVPSSAHEPFLSTTRDQDYMINEIVKTHRVRAQSRRIPSDDEDDLPNELAKPKDNPKKNEREADQKSSSPVGQLRKRSPEGLVGSFKQRHEIDLDAVSTSSTFSTTSTDDETDKQRKAPFNSMSNPIKIVQEIDQLEKPIVSLHDELNNTELAAADSSSASSPIQSAQSTSPEAILENVDGDIALSSGEIIQMSLSVFKDDVEKFQRLFSVYVDHAVGQPKRRFLLLTDIFLYVLTSRIVVAGEPINQLTRAAELSYLSSTPAMESFFEDSADDTSQTADTSFQINYTSEIEIQLNDIDYITLGVDAQSVTIHTKMHKFKTPTSDHEQKQFVVETASEKLGQCIVANLQNAIRKFTKKHNQVQVVSGTTLYSIILRNFVRRELGLPSVDLKHGALSLLASMPG